MTLQANESARVHHMETAESKPDWPEARARLCAWWAGQRIDRAVAIVTSPRRGVAPRPYRGGVPQKYTDTDTVLHNAERAVALTFHGGEAIPAHWVYLGPIPMTGYVGGELRFEENTVWHPRRFDTWDPVESLAFDPENRYYRLLRELTRAAVQRAAGRWWVSAHGAGACSDVMADLWGTDKALLAMAEQPEAVRTAMRRLTDISLRLFDELETLTAPHQDGGFDWITLWAPGRIWTMQSDLCGMISPAMFEEFVLPELRAQSEHADHAFYHLDGPAEITHLDALLSLPRLRGIQWVPGPGAGCQRSADPLEWLDLFQRIQSAGKRLWVACPPQRVKPLLAKVDRQSICLRVSCESQEQAEAVLSEMDRIGA